MPIECDKINPPFSTAPTTTDGAHTHTHPHTHTHTNIHRLTHTHTHTPDSSAAEGAPLASACSICTKSSLSSTADAAAEGGAVLRAGGSGDASEERGVCRAASRQHCARIAAMSGAFDWGRWRRRWGDDEQRREKRKREAMGMTTAGRRRPGLHTAVGQRRARQRKPPLVSPVRIAKTPELTTWSGRGKWGNGNVTHTHTHTDITHIHTKGKARTHDAQREDGQAEHIRSYLRKCDAGQRKVCLLCSVALQVLQLTAGAVCEVRFAFFEIKMSFPKLNVYGENDESD